MDRVRLENRGKLNDKIAYRALGIEGPADLDTEELRTGIMNLFHLRQSGVITFRVDPKDGEQELVVESPPPKNGLNSLQFGVGFVNDFRGHTGYTLTVRHQYLPANSYGGEWQNILQVGSIEKLGSQFYQPLDGGLKWFVAPAVLLTRFEQELWADGEPLAEYRVRQKLARVNFGRVLGNWGQLRIGAFVSDNKAEPRIGDPSFPSTKEDRGGIEADFFVDTEDSVSFPQSGALVNLSYSKGIEGAGSDLEFEQLFASASQAWTTGKFTFVPYLEYGDCFGDTDSFFDTFTLGGLGRLSGLGSDELIGEKLAFARLSFRRSLLSKDLGGVRLRFYAGMSLEAGNVYDHDDSIDLDSLMTSWSLYVGAETPIGPLFLGYGNTEGRDRVYLAIGDYF